MLMYLIKSHGPQNNYVLINNKAIKYEQLKS